MKKILLIAVLASSSLISCASQPVNLAWKNTGFHNPESMVYDKTKKVIYVSNVNGHPFKKDGIGSISLLSRDGKVVEHQWVTGLDAPKGLAVYKNNLYVSDINKLVVIDTEKRKITQTYTVKDAKFLNDVAVDSNGVVYVSDMMDNAIYSLNKDKFTLWKKDVALQSPNGLFIEDDHMIVGSWGTIKEGFSTSVFGNLKTVSLKTRKITSLGNGTPVANLDGVESDGKGNYFVTDWMVGALYKIDPTGKFKMLLDLKPGSADIGIIHEDNILLIPMFHESEVYAYHF